MSTDEVYVVLSVLLTFLILIALYSTRKKASFAMPSGYPVYGDLRSEGKILRSLKYGITGKPDKVMQGPEGLVPYEYKTTDSTTPREGHMLQMAAYFLILEENFPAANVSHGVLKYRNTAFRIENSSELRMELLNVVERIRQGRGMPERNHNSPRRCVFCSFRETCPQKLIK